MSVVLKPGNPLPSLHAVEAKWETWPGRASRPPAFEGVEISCRSAPSRTHIRKAPGARKSFTCCPSVPGAHGESGARLLEVQAWEAAVEDTEPQTGFEWKGDLSLFLR